MVKEDVRAAPQALNLALRCLLIVVAVSGGIFLTLGVPWGGQIPPYRIDLDVYRLGGQAFLAGADLYGRLPDTAVGLNLPFTYPPIAAALFVPFALMPYWLANLLFGLSTLACLFVVIQRVLGEVAVPCRMDPTWACIACFALFVWATPVQETVSFGQVNVMLMALVVIDALAGRGRWWQGTLIGLAIAIKLTPAVFLAYFLVRRNWRALLVGSGSALAFTLAGFLMAPASSVRYWTETIGDPSRIGGLGYVSNQSINGFLVRLGSGGRRPILVRRVCRHRARVTHRDARTRRARRRRCCPPGHGGLRVAGLAGVMVASLGVGGASIDDARRLGFGEPKVVAVGGVIALGLAVFYSAIIWWMPHEEGREMRWTWYQHILGNAHLWWGLAFLGCLAARALTPAPEVRR